MKKKPKSLPTQPNPQASVKKKDYSSVIVCVSLLITMLVFSTTTLDRVLWIRLLLSQIVLGVFALLFFAKLKNMQLHFELSVLEIVLLVYALYSIIPLQITHNFQDGRMDWLKTMFLCLVPILLSKTVNALDFIEKILKTLLLFSAIALVVGGGQLVSILMSGDVSHARLYDVYSLFAHKNLFSEILLQILCFALISSFVLKEWWRLAARIIAGLAFAFIVVLMTRAVWVAGFMAVLSAVFALIVSRQLVSFTKALRYVVIAAALIVVVIGVYAKFGSSTAFSTQFNQIFAFDYGTTKDRIVLWQKTKSIIDRAPVFGNGQGMWKLQIMDRGSNELLSSDNVTFYQQPHNDMLWLASEQGLIGAVLYLLLFVVAGVFCLQAARNSLDKNSKVMAVILFAALCGFFTASLFSFPRERIEHISLLALLFLFSILLKNSVSDIRIKAPRYSGFLLGGFALIISIVGLTWAAKRFSAEKDVKLLLDVRASQDLAGVVTVAESIDTSVCQLDPFTTPLAWYKGEALFNLNRTEEAHQAFLSAWRRNPWHVHVLNNLGTSYETRGEHDSALACYERSLLMSPHFNDALLNAAAIRFNFKHYDEASNLINRLDTTQLSPRGRLFIKTIDVAIIRQLANLFAEEKTRIEIHALSQNEEFVFDVHFKSVKNNCSFKQQLLSDYLHMKRVQNIKVSLQTLEMIKKEYLPNLEIEKYK